MFPKMWSSGGWRWHATLLGLLVSGLAASQLSLTPEKESQIHHGRTQYEVLKTDSRLPKYGPCWKDALRQLDIGCQHLTDDEQSFLALQFANCFLAKAGLPTYPCLRSQLLSECLRDMDHRAFGTFSDFFTHTQNMCYFLQSQVWHEETEETITRLSEASAQMSLNLEDSSTLQAIILSHQRESLEFQKQIAANGTILSQAIVNSKENVRHMLEEFKSSTQEQRTMIFEIFDRLSKLQNLVVNEVSWLYSVVFYGAFLLIVYLGTATKRTSEARLLVYCVLFVNFILERLICQWSLMDAPTSAESLNLELGGEDLPETIYYRIWLLRKLTVFVSVCLTGYFAVNFVDYNRVNNQILEDIRRQNADLKHKMEVMQVSSLRPHLPEAQTLTQDLTDGLLFHPNPFTGGFSDTGELADYSDDEGSGGLTDDDTLSFNSTQTDQTWLTGQHHETADLSEIASSDDDEEVEKAEAGFMASLAAIRSARSSPQPIAKAKGGGGARTSRSTTPVSLGLNESRHSYNLRSRSHTPALDELKPEFAHESDSAFGRTVTKMANITKRNSAKIRLALKKTGSSRTQSYSNYSSDEA